MPRKFMNTAALDLVVNTLADIQWHLRNALDTGEIHPHVGAALAASLSCMEVIRAEVKALRQERTSWDQSKAKDSVEDR